MNEIAVTLRDDLSGHETTVASWEYVREIQDQFGLSRELAEQIADFIVAEIEREGGARAELYFTEDGTGPHCSWCGAIAGLCLHIAGKGKESAT